jgi:hypothetical protein
MDRRQGCDGRKRASSNARRSTVQRRPRHGEPRTRTRGLKHHLGASPPSVVHRLLPSVLERSRSPDLARAVALPRQLSGSTLCASWPCAHHGGLSRQLGHSSRRRPALWIGPPPRANVAVGTLSLRWWRARRRGATIALGRGPDAPGTSLSLAPRCAYAPGPPASSSKAKTTWMACLRRAARSAITRGASAKGTTSVTSCS